MPSSIAPDSPGIGMQDPRSFSGVSGDPAASLPPGSTYIRPQRPFATQTMYTTSPWVPRIARGYIQRFDTASSAPYGNRFGFCFNPNQIDTQYAISSDTISSMQQDVAGNIGGIGGPSTVSFSFQLFIDRSYEVAYQGDTEGATHDVGVLEDLLAVSALNPYMTQAAVNKFVLGSKLVFYAWVSSMSVSYMYFNQDMIPMRCTIDISATLQSVLAGKNDTLKSSASSNRPLTGKVTSKARR